MGGHEKSAMKKPAAARKDEKKRSACMKMRKAMKKKVGRHQEITKRSGVQQRAYKENVVKNKERMKKKNVKNRARRAARNGKKYQTLCPELEHLAVAAYAKAMERANSAHETADKALEEAGEAKKDAAGARAMASENSQRITSLKEEVMTELGTLARRAKRSEERLTADERMRGYVFSSPKTSGALAR